MDLEGIDDGLRNAADWQREREKPAVTVAARARLLNPTRFLNRASCHSFLMEYAEANRTHKYERVSNQTLVDLNEGVRQMMINHVRRLPSKGKTI